MNAILYLIVEGKDPNNHKNNARTSEGQRPFYNIGHMCNSISKTKDFLNRGANAIEIDVSFHDDDIYLHHGSPCDCFRYCNDRVSLIDYLRFARKVTDPKEMSYWQAFVLLYFDLKLKNFDDDEKYYQGRRLANYLKQYFFVKFPVPNTLRMIVAISYADDESFIEGFVNRLKELEIFDQVKSFIGFDVGIEKDLQRAKRIWSTLNLTNVWQGEGITNCLNPLAGNNLRNLVSIRDGSDPYFSKVYRWTVDLSDSLRSVLDLHIDGVMTNVPERVNRIIHSEPDFAMWYRLAEFDDDPFERFRWPATGPARNPLHKTTNTRKIRNAIKDFGESFRLFIREIYKSTFFG
ncbi:sphingomyelin phosphodiesterase D SpaSicTox-betaIF1-like protein [Sarcoptes scabiei]|uniref:Sphingomyelin phosphodiesterase D SpaSicTox-betaIF1-like protein n=1 Tax=Sarcoptes scabiei TaxID=52283 RepID=A0A132ADV1_SARSC|nr:sphingomyelin phosphodiesterase D SpaSicTox-betaIF1-like protein [Sarcoptes scabiei]